MITHDTRLLKQWIVSLVAILLSSVEATVTTSCDIPSVDEGQQTKLTCMFSEDISRAQVDFKVELYSLAREPLSVPILDCVWFNGKLDCRVHSCCSFDKKVTDNATLVILNATQDLVGKYMCHVVPSSPGSSHFCNFTVNKIVSTGRPAAIGTDGVESNSFPVVPVVVGVVVPVVVVVIAIIVILYMRRKGRYRNELRDNIPKEDNSSGNEYSRRQHLTIENHALEERKSEIDPPLKKSEVSPLLKKSEVDSMLEKSEVSPLLEKSEVSPLLKKSEVYPLLEKSEVSPLLKKSEVDSLLEKSEISPLLEKSEVSPLLEKSEVSPLLDKSEVSPLLEKSEVSPLLEKSEVSPLLEKSESLYFDTTDSNNASDTGNEKYPKETGGFVQKPTNNPGPLTDSVAEDVIETRNIPTYFKYNDGKDYSKDSTAERRRNLFKYSQQSEKMTEAKYYDTTNAETDAKHSDTTNAETEEINFTSDIKPVSPKEDENCSFLQDTTTSQGDLSDSRSASMKPDSENCTPRLPNLNEGARAVPVKAKMDSHNTPSHTLPFSDANPTIKEEFTVNDKDSRLCSLAAQDPLVNATNGNHTEVSEKTEAFRKYAYDKFDEIGDLADYESENKNEEDFNDEYNGSTT